MLLSLSLPDLAQSKFRAKFPNFIFWNFKKQIAQCDSTTEEVSFEWSHHKISSADVRVEVTFKNAIEHSGSERVSITLDLFIVYVIIGLVLRLIVIFGCNTI